MSRQAASVGQLVADNDSIQEVCMAAGLPTIQQTHAPHDGETDQENTCNLHQHMRKPACGNTANVINGDSSGRLCASVQVHSQ